jgi:hypothetical protein
MKKAAKTAHENNEMPRQKTYQPRPDMPDIILPALVYVGKGYKALFLCPECGNKTWQSLNFLGQRKVYCDGLKITKK